MISALLAILFALLIASFLQGISQRSHLPFSVLLVCCGIAFGLVATEFQFSWQTTLAISTSHNLILLILLPTLVFETAFTQVKNFFLELVQKQRQNLVLQIARQLNQII